MTKTSAAEPFVGPAGRVLDQALDELGIERGSVYLTNEAYAAFVADLRVWCLLWTEGRLNMADYAAQAGIRLADKPAPLFQLLVLTILASARIRSEIAVDAARELFEAGWRTPKAMAESTWSQRVGALGRAHYVRYDRSTARALREAAVRVLEVYHGDLRELAEAADRKPRRLRTLLTEFPRIGPTGADIFCREAKDVWPWAG